MTEPLGDPATERQAREIAPPGALVVLVGYGTGHISMWAHDRVPADVIAGVLRDAARLAENTPSGNSST